MPYPTLIPKESALNQNGLEHMFNTLYNLKNNSKINVDASEL
jgi:hypothetical protein